MNGCPDCEEADTRVRCLTEENETLHSDYADLQGRYDALKNAAQNAHDNITAQLNTLDGAL